MFLEKVGITNSFNDDNEHRHRPFFVSHPIYFLIYFITGSKWYSIHSCQKEGIVFRHLK